MNIIIIIIVLLVLGQAFSAIDRITKYCIEHKWIIWLVSLLILFSISLILGIIGSIICVLYIAYIILKECAEDELKKRGRELISRFEIINDAAIISACWNDQDIKGCFNLINLHDINDKCEFSKLILPIIDDIAKERISDYLLKSIQLYGAFTLDEAVEIAQKDSNISKTFNLNNRVSVSLTDMVAKGLLVSQPISKNDILYENNTDIGQKIQVNEINLD